MKPIEEALLMAFYSHRLHVEDVCKNIEHPSSAMLKLCEDLFSLLLNTDSNELVDAICKYGFRFDISTSDVPQFSSLEDCVYKVPFLVQNCGIEDITYTQMGYMLRTKPRKEGADLKYGENHSKTAAQMGLCAISKCRVYPSYLGIAFQKLTKEEQRLLTPKIILFIPYIYNQYASKATHETIMESVSILKESTQKRRLSNIWSLVNQVNAILPYELQIIRY